MKKKLLSALLALCMLMTLAPVTVFAAETKSVNNATDLTDAITSASSGGTIKLSGSITDDNTTLTIPADKTLTLDLASYTLTIKQIKVAGNLTIRASQSGGKFVSTNSTDNGSAIEVTGTGKVILESGTIASANGKKLYGIYANEGGTAIVKDGTISTYYAPLGGNNTTGDMNFEINGGTLTAQYGPAIYMPGQVLLTITGGTLNGGISLRMGQVNISGGTINAVDDKSHIDSPNEFYNYSGNAWLPDALYVFNGTYTSENTTHGNSLNLNITGGTFNCTNDQGSAVAIYDLGKVQQKSKVSISGTANLSCEATNRDAYQVLSLSDIGVSSPATGYGKYTGNVVSAISGGEFSSDVSKYVAADYTCTGSESNWKVSKKENIKVEEPTVDSNSNTVTTVVGGENLDVSKDNNLNTESTTLTIDASAASGADSATTSEVVMGGTAISEISNSDAVKDVKITTNVGTLTVSEKALATIVDNATTDGTTADVTLSIEKKDDSSTGGSLIYTLTAVDANGNEVYGENDAKGTIKVTVPFDGADKPAVFYLPETGSPVKVADDKVELDTNKKLLTWTVEHFSDWRIEKSDSETSWVENGQTKFGALDTALTQVPNGGTITLHENITTTDNYKINIANGKTVTIAGNGHTISINYTETNASVSANKTAPSVEVGQNGKLILDNVKLKVTGNANGVDNGKTDIKMGTGITVNKTGTLELKNGTEVTLDTLSRGFIMGGTPATNDLGTVVVDGSKLTVSNVSGNGSNGGSWDIKNNSVVNFTTCGNFGFSVEELKVSGQSQVTVDGAAYAGIVSTDIDLSEGAVVTVKNCGALLPYGSTYAPDTTSFKNAVELKANGELQMNDATLNLENNTDSNANKINTIYAGATDTTVLMKDSTFNGVLPTANTTVLNTVVNGTLTTSTTDTTKTAMYNNTLYTLTEALTQAGSSGTVYLVADAELTSDLSTGVTLVVPTDTKLTVEKTNLTNLAKGGTLEVQAGGGLKLAGESFVGGTDARLNLTKGSVTMQGLQIALKSDSAATIPSGKEFFLQLGSGNGAKAMTAEIETDATLTVEGKLTVVNDSELTVTGTLSVAADGIVRVNSEAEVKGSGAITNHGVIALMEGASDKAAVAPTVTLASGGAVYSQFDIGDTITIKNVKEEALTTPITVNGVANSSAEEQATPPTFGYKYSYYVSSGNTGGGGGGGGTTTYSVTLPTDVANGTLSVSPKSAAKDATVTITVTPDEGYQLDTLTVTDKDGKAVELTKKSDTQYTFKMPASKVSVQASFAPVETPPATLPFTDVTGHWALDAITYVYENGMMNGTSPTTFSPESQLTRGMIVTILYRLEDEPAVSDSTFSDVDGDMYYADPIAWAADNGIVTGFPDGTFGPETSITREQLATILYRYADYLDCDMTPAADLSGYTDAGTISSYAQQAMAWANAEGLITGVTETTLKPTGTATRAQVATILMRFCENVIK